MITVVGESLVDVVARQGHDELTAHPGGSPANVAQAVLAFVDNDYVTGACLPVDGGRTIFSPQ